MTTRERRILEQLIKEWAQDHTTEYMIADYTANDEGMENTQGYFTWLVQEKRAHIDLLALADRIELWLQSKRRQKQPDGMICQKCQVFYEFAEPNQKDGSLVCYSCRTNPYYR